MSLVSQCLATFFCAQLCLLAVLIGQDDSRSWNFEGEQVGRLPSGFSNEAGDWKVGPRTPGGGKALTQQARSASPVYNLALARDISYLNVEVSVELKADAGEVDQGGGLVWRARDAKNYYIARYNPLENNFRAYKVVNGARTQLATADVPGNREWHTLRVTMSGNRMECFLDNRKYLEARDDTFASAGMIGVWTKADAQTQFDNLSARSLSNTR